MLGVLAIAVAIGLCMVMRGMDTRDPLEVHFADKAAKRAKKAAERAQPRVTGGSCGRPLKEHGQELQEKVKGRKCPECGARI